MGVAAADAAEADAAEVAAADAEDKGIVNEGN
jgi:hypothetical protein